MADRLGASFPIASLTPALVLSRASLTPALVLSRASLTPALVLGKASLTPALVLSKASLTPGLGQDVGSSVKTARRSQASLACGSLGSESGSTKLERTD